MYMSIINKNLIIMKILDDSDIEALNNKFADGEPKSYT